MVNTALAQQQVDKEYWEESEAQMDKKNRIAWKRAKRLIATEKPLLFFKVWVESNPLGSVQRNKELKFLRKFSPEFYEFYCARSGEVVEEAVHEVQREEPQQEGNKQEDVSVVEEATNVEN